MADQLTLGRHAMKDPTTSHLRIYVGGLSEQTTIDSLYDHFISFGKILGIVINKGFGFVQFENEKSAQVAISTANGGTFQGRLISVKTAQTNSDKAKREETQPILETPSDNAPVANDEGTDDHYDSFGNYIGDQSGTGESYNGANNDNYNQQNRQDNNRNGRGRRGPRRRGGRGGGGGDIPGFRERSPVGGRGGPWADHVGYDRFSQNMEYPMSVRVNERNDCEIIVVSKALTEYAEYIEGRLKRLGVVVDLLFPMEDVTIGKVLGNIASRGCLYAILVMPQNQENRSLTLTILHGLPQEHRNMPIEDALQLLSRNYQEVQRGGSSGREAVYALLGQLADGRTLTVLQYEKVIEYLQERKEQQVKVELGEPLSKDTNKDKTQVDLQQRILSILNDKKTAQSEPTPAPVPVPSPVPAAAPQNKLLNDPTVRKALDSILQNLV